MSEMAGNWHYGDAQQIISSDKGWVAGWETADAQHLAAHSEANMQATLALAYELRTATLVALYTGTEWLGESVTLQQQIKERLGLEESNV